MAHDKVYGICENKCMVEVSEKEVSEIGYGTALFVLDYLVDSTFETKADVYDIKITVSQNYSLTDTRTGNASLNSPYTEFGDKIFTDLDFYFPLNIVKMTTDKKAFKVVVENQSDREIDYIELTNATDNNCLFSFFLLNGTRFKFVEPTILEPGDYLETDRIKPNSTYTFYCWVQQQAFVL